MKKFLIGLLTGLVVAGLSMVVLAFSLLRFGDTTPRISSGSTLILTLDGDLPEKSPVDIPIPFIGGPTASTVQEVWSGLKRASSDSRIKALVVITGHVNGGWAKADEVRRDIIEFKKSGKPVIALVKWPRAREYYIATAADKIYMANEDLLDLKGLRAELTYVKGTLDKLGVQAEFQHAGKYKDAGDMMTQTAPTPETREVMNSMLDSLYSHLLQTIATGRKRNVEDIRRIVDNGPFTAKQAAANGLVDALRYEDQVYGELKDQLKLGELKKVSHRDYFASIAEAGGGGKRIALIVGQGSITRGGGEDAMGSDDIFSSGAFIRMLRRVSGDAGIDGVILRIDSPGGDAFASDEMLREVRLLSQKKPMVVSMSDAAASGGYYVAMTGDPIVAYPNTFTGSIGVIYGKMNLRGLYDKLGVTKEIMSRGRNAAIDSSYQPLDDTGRAKLQESIDETYRTFVQHVAEGRKKKYEEIEPLAQGRVWLGSQAKQNGLIDEVGGLERALELVKQKAKIGATEQVRVIPYPPKRSIFDQWIKSTQEPAVEARLREFLGFDWRLWTRGGMMRVMPYRIAVD